MKSASGNTSGSEWEPASGEWERGAASRLLNGNSSVGTDRLWLQTSRADRFCRYRGAGLSPGAGTPPGKRSAGKHRAVHVVCMPSEGTARAAQLATFSGHRQHSRRHRRPEVWLTESLRRRAARPTPRVRACSSYNHSQGPGEQPGPCARAPAARRPVTAPP
eukprot:scaffold9029_cov69-Phaeocystis_antarctica.AAC.3